MICTFYTCNDNNTKITKTLLNPVEKNLKIRNSLDFDDPILLLSFNPLTQNLNYAKIENIYYFIKNADIYRNRLYKVSLHIDVLMTYADYIKSLTGNITTSENPNSDFVNTDMSTSTVTKEFALNDIFDHTGKIYLTTVFNT